MLGRAIAFAAKIHETQKDKAGKSYILHPIRMMMRLRTNDDELMCIAIMHDVIEDTSDLIDSNTLRMSGFTERVIQGVDALTRRDNELYEDFIKRCALNPDARLVKLEDLRDNSDITRLKGIRKKDLDRCEKYHKAFMYLSD